VWLLPLLAQSIALPPETPIPCLICRAGPQQELVFSGTVQLAQIDRIQVFNGKTRQTMGFHVPAGFHGVESSDGKIKDAAVTSVPPGLLARVTYRTLADDRHEVTRVLLLTINQCRALVAAERLSDLSADCPD
jgi:hypothetical protein